MSQKDLIRITLIGDVFPGELPYTQDYGIRTQFGRHKGTLWSKRLKEILGSNDIIIGNLESSLINIEDSTKKTFCGSPEFAGFLKECGINVLNIANNHILEHGALGFNRTIEFLGGAGIGIVGNETGSGSNICYREVKGLKIAVAGFSNVDLNVIINDGSFSVLNEINVITALRRMEEDKASLKILCFHWGNEYIRIPSSEQRRLAYKFIDAGANIIAGHHPHVIQPYEKYKNGHIFYSLGNFMFDYIFSKVVSIGLVSKLEIENQKKIQVNIKGVRLSYKNTFSAMPEVYFNKYYSDILKQYDNASIQSDKVYKINYYTLLKKEHLKQRILMKTSLIREFCRINFRDKFYLLRNIYNYYFISKYKQKLKPLKESDIQN